MLWGMLAFAGGEVQRKEGLQVKEFAPCPLCVVPSVRTIFSLSMPG